MRALRLVLVAVVAAAAPAAACGSNDSDRGPAVVPGAPAGDVREVSGAVTARRGDEPARALAVGDVVAGDDVIATGADGAVVIELRHNGARWSLAAGQERAVSASAAWSAPRREGVAAAGDRSTAAGRHAEREAADTAASAVAAAEREEALRATASSQSERERQAALARDAEERARMQAQEEAARDEAPAEAAAAPPPPPPKPTTRSKPRDDDRAIGLGNIGTVGKGGGGGGGTGYGAGAGGAKDVERAPDAKVVIGESSDPTSDQSVLRRHAAAFRACYQQLLRTHPGAQGRIDVELAVDAAGKVTNATAKASGAVDGARACVLASARRMRFPASDDARTIAFPLVLTSN